MYVYVVALRAWPQERGLSDDVRRNKYHTSLHDRQPADFSPRKYLKTTVDVANRVGDSDDDDETVNQKP